MKKLVHLTYSHQEAVDELKRIMAPHYGITEQDVTVVINPIPQPVPMISNKAVLDRPFPSQVVEQIRIGNKIAAIKELRIQWGNSLKEAKDLVELYSYVFMGGGRPF